MIETQIIEALLGFRLLPYIDEIATRGRETVEPDLRQQAVALFDFADGVLTFETSLDGDARAALNLVRDVLYSEKFLSLDRQQKPNYVAYTNLKVLDRHLLADQAAPLSTKWDAAKRSLALVIADWHDREQDRLSSYETSKLDTTLLGFTNDNVTGDQLAHLKERERSLDALSKFSAVHGLPDTQIIMSEIQRHETDWTYFARSPEKQVAHLTCMPRSRWHDEYMFLRTIHATECCFAGILAGLLTLPPVVRSREFSVATEILKGTLYFADFLTKLFSVFETMPIAHFFSGFREATGNASAIQSIRFQTIEVLTRGLDSSKRNALSKQTEVGFAAKWLPPADATLDGMCNLARGVTYGEEFIEVAELLSEHLYTWRAKHYGIARKYLPRDAIGTGQEGISYLAKNFKSPMGVIRSEGQEAAEANNDLAPARISLSFSLRKRGVPHVSIVSAGSISEENLRSALAILPYQTQTLCEQRKEIIQTVLSGYKRYFEGLSYPVERQLKSFQRNGALPADPVRAALLSLEFRTGALFGLFNAGRISGQMVFDTASEGESFEGIDGKYKKCSADEVIVRDERGIIASVLQGPDKRTSALPPTSDADASWAFIAFGYPSMPKEIFEVVTEEAKVILGSFGAENINVWSRHGN